LDDLKKLFEQLSWKQKYYKNQYLQTLNDFYAAKKTWDIELSNVEKDYSDISIAHNKLLEENRWLKSEMDSIVEKTNESIKKKQEYEMEIQSLLKLKQKNAICLKELYKEAYRIGAFFVGTKYKTDELEEKIAETRRKFKGREEFLKKLTRGEVAAGIVIQKILYSIQEAQLIERQSLVKKKAMYVLVLEEIESPMLQLENDAIRIRTIHDKHAGALRDILKRKNQVQKSVEKTKKKLRSRGKKTRVVLTETADKRSTVYKELEITKSKTITFNTKIQELKKELKEMEEQKINFDKKLEILNNEFLDVRFKKEHLQAVFDHLMEEKRNCEDRITEEALKFRRLIATRQQTLANIQKTKEKLLEENLCLAQEYQMMQNIYLKEKDNYFKVYDKQLSLDASVSDKKQFCQLQRRLGKLWQEHFKLVVFFSQMKLAKLQTDSQKSIQKILAVQEESSNLMQHILDFFQTLKECPDENDG
uniref:Coiled-coil domain-containing protein 178 n=1 Tax=Castor canadensis TaxID=51338 RepID=A0A8B7WHT9_CASCN